MNSFQFKGFGLAYPVFTPIKNWQRDWLITCKISTMKISMAIRKIGLPFFILLLIFSCEGCPKKTIVQIYIGELAYSWLSEEA